MWVHDKEIYISKKCVSSHCQYQSKKALFTNPISSEGFACTLEIRTAQRRRQERRRRQRRRQPSSSRFFSMRVMSRRKTDTKTLLHNNNTPRLWKRVKWISGERIKLLKKINANAPAKTLHFISSPRSMCHTIKPGPRRKMLSITIKFISTPQLFCFEDCVLKQHSWDMFTSKVSNSQYFRRWTRLYPPWLFWLLVNYYYVYLFFSFQSIDT